MNEAKECQNGINFCSKLPRRHSKLPHAVQSYPVFKVTPPDPTNISLLAKFAIISHLCMTSIAAEMVPVCYIDLLAYFQSNFFKFSSIEGIDG